MLKHCIKHIKNKDYIFINYSFGLLKLKVNKAKIKINVKVLKL